AGRRDATVTGVQTCALPTSARLGDPMPAIAQATLGCLHYQRSGLRAPYINRRQQVFVRICHAYWFSCSLGIAGLGFLALVPFIVDFSALGIVCTAGFDAPVLTFGETTTIFAAFPTDAPLLVWRDRCDLILLFFTAGLTSGLGGRGVFV